jgi:Predicted signal-transduction protein containing cAMP-binding and CBS domains
MITVTELLAAKQQKTPISVRSKSTVFDALKLMSEKQVSALAIVDDPGKLAGIFTERDCAHKITLGGRPAKETSVAEVMTPGKRVYFVQPSNSIDECMVLMTAKQVRHLPVLDQGRFVGLVSIGDVVRSLIAEKENIIEQLSGYILARQL